MKVKVRRVTAWPETAKRLPTATLQGIVRRHAQGDLPLSSDTLFIILGELVRRREESDSPFRSNEEAWAGFVAYYMSKEG